MEFNCVFAPAGNFFKEVILESVLGTTPPLRGTPPMEGNFCDAGRAASHVCDAGRAASQEFLRRGTRRLPCLRRGTRRLPRAASHSQKIFFGGALTKSAFCYTLKKS